MRNKYTCISGLSITKCILLVLLVTLPNVFFAQQSPSIQTGVTFQWDDTQTNNSDPATIQSVTIDGTVYNTFVVPSSYEMTRLGPDGHNPNNIRLNGGIASGSSNAGNWIASATQAFQSKNLNYYFEANPNGRNICSNFNAALTTDAQKQTIFYSPAIPSNQGGVLAVTERGANNCFYIEVWGTPAGGGSEQKLGETFVRNTGNYTGCNFGPPLPNSDYWQSGRCNENGQTVGVALFYLNNLAPTGSQITKIEFVAATRDHGDGKFFILQKYAVDQTKTNCIDEAHSGDLDKQNNVPSGSTYSLVSGPSPAGQSFNLNSNGTYTYVPTPGYTGDVVFDYEVCLPAPNTSVCDTGTVTLSYIDLPPNPTFSISCSATNEFIITVDNPIGAEFEYSIDGGSTYQDAPIFSDLGEGSYALLVRNKYVGCVTSFTNNPIIIENLNLSAQITDVACKLEDTGAIDITVSGGTPPYTYSWSNSATSEDISNVFGGTYTVTVTDANGCSISDSFTINQPAEELSSTIANTNNILCFGENSGSIDLEVSGGTTPYSYLWNNGEITQDLSNLGVGNYTVTITDANGCEITNQATITEPSAQLSANIFNVINVDCSGESSGSFTVNTSGGTSPYQYSIDNGNNYQSSNLFENLTDGSYTVFITDANNCNTTITATIGVNDTENPTISVPNTVSIQGCTTSDITTENSVFNFNDSGSSDIKSAFTNNQNYNASDDFNISSITYIDVITSTNCPVVVERTFTITDNCNNIAIAQQIITVEDSTPPTISVPADITIECTDDESSANTGVATGADTCGTVTITESDVETAACGNTKTIVRTWTVTDECGNSVSADQTITVVDTTDPTISVPADITIECTDDASSANTGVATGADTCSTVTITESDVETASCGNTKTIVRTWTVTDECGNSVSADQTITVVDTTPPTIDNTNTDNIVIQCGVAPDGTLEAWLANNAGATANDTCGTVTWSNDYGANTDVDCANGAITVTFTATDECGNTANTTATYSIIDTVDPVLTIPADTSVECTDDTSPASTGTATATDDCAVPNVTFSDVEVAACGNTKTITRTWTATDACGNSVSADQTITVVDTTDPTISVPADITIECTEDESSANTGVATGVDTCGTVTITESDAETAACGNTKTIVRTWTVTDECGNSVSADQTITVVDTTDPTINVPADITIECTEDESSANTGVATGTDTCGTITITESDVETAACGNTKTIVRTWTVTDECGNSVSADQTITVVDTTDPTINVPADVTIECTEDESSANTGVATGADTCGTVTITESDVETAACGNTKTIVRTWTVTDECGNSVSADQTITVVDTTPPTIDNTNTDNIVIQCGITPDGTLEAWLANNAGATANDTCGTVTWSNDYGANTDVDCANGAITVTFTATDECGNTANTTATYSIIDTVDPVLTIPADTSVECTDDTSPASTGTATATDDCAVPNVTFSDVEVAACGNTKTITRTWTATDACGNSVSADQTITVVDTTDPTINVPADITIECTEDESSANTGVATGADTCGTVTITESDVETAACGNTKTIVRTWTVTDECGNSVSADQTITVVDTTDPTINVPADITIECTDDASSANTGVATGADTCGTVTITESDVETAACGNTKTIVRTWTVTDECGNSVSADQTITVEDTTPPTITVPADITIECTEDESSANTGVATGVDTCGTVTITESDVETAACGNTKTIVRTWTVTDECGNSVSADQTITVVDTTDPTINVPADVTIECTEDESSANTGVATGADTCGTVTITESDVETAACGNTKTIVRTWTVTDECGNSVSADQTITVVDTTDPTINVPADITIECTEDESSANTGVATGADTCGTVTITESDVETAACGNTKTIVRTWTVTDECGNSVSADQTITVVDTTDPTINVPADVTIECTEDESSANTGVATGADTCGTVTITESDVETAACGNTKTIVRTWTVTDECGNSVSADQTITVVDTTDPTINVPADITIECTEDESSANTGVATGADTCGTVTITESDVETAACGNTKTIVRTWTVTDECGNSVSADQTITVEDTTPPTITVPADITIECTEDESSANTGVATGADTCGTVTITESDVETAACGNTKTIVRTWTVTDECGNSVSADQTITVVDTTPPTIDNTNTDNIVIQCGITPDGTLEAWLANNAGATANDTCGTVTWSNDYGANTDVDCANGAITVTFTATDECGNTANTTATYSIIDTVDPVLTIPADTSVECTDDTSPASTGTATATDDCAVPNVTFSDVEVAACGNTKTITRTWTATDACGNSVSADQTITVVDTTDPTISVPADITIECTEDESSANTGVATGADTCGTVTITESDVETAACGNTKTIVRTWTVTDECGNSVSADQTITVVDTTDPTINVPADITIECTEDESSANTGVATGADTCGTVTITESDVETAACGNTKTIVRTWTVTDECGNSVSADQTITVVDTTDPTINVPADVTIECTEDESSANTGVATGADTCGTVTITESDVETAACGNTKTIVRTWTVTDECGNSVSADQTITVVDTTDPTINVPADITIECTEDASSANTGVATGADTCGTVTITESDVETAACGNTKTIVRTWTVTDECGNSVSADQTITVVDTTDPTINVPADVTIECTEDASSANTGVATGADTCGTVTITESDVETASCGNTKTIVRTWTVTDECGNSVSADQTITVVDTTPPTIDNTNTDNIVIQCGVAPDGTLEAWLANNAGATANDTCGTVTWSNDYGANTDVDCANGAITVTFTATDECGNTANTTATYSIIDTVDPVLTIPADTSVECTDDTSPASTGTATATDDCAVPNVTFSDVEVAACGNTKTITRTWTATDACGNSVSADQTITVVDTTDPTISVPADITIECTEDESSANTGVATGADTCGTVTITESDVETAACGNTKTIVRTWTVTDECGNSVSADQTITVVDTTDPTINVPADITIECTEDESSANTGVATGADTCGTVTITESDVETAACGNTKTIVRTWTVTDECGNSVSADQTITVVDTTPPTFNEALPADVTVECDAVPTAETLTANDNCGNATVTFAETTTAGTCDNDYTLTRTWTASDACGNETVHTQTITVQDTTPPTFNEALPADVTVECDAVPTAETLTANDNCGNATVTFAETTTAGTCDNDYTLTRTWTASDACGSETVHTQTITVQDTTAPTFNEALPADVTFECDAVPTAETLTANDNCGDATVTLEETTTAGTCDNDYTLTRTWTASDACGNETVHTQTITVQDTTAPTFNEALPADVTVECDAVPTAETLTANDNCGDATVTFEEEITSGACMGDYIIERTWTAADACGNDTIHIQIITVQDTAAPTMVNSFDENIIVSCDAIPEVPNLVFEDACSNNISVSFNESSTQTNDFEDYFIIRTWTVTDDCGNVAEFTQNITVEISNVIDAFDASRCLLDAEFDLFDLLSGDFSMDGTWSVVSGDATIDGSLFDPSSVDVGEYTFMYAITEGPCPTEVEVIVTVDDDCVVLPCGAEDVVISKTVTANGDSYNEFFTITGVEDCGFVIELQIFNRWGAEIYKNNNYQNDWNGDAHGSSVGSSGKVPTGTYYYVINLRNSGLKPFAGPIYVATDK
ncbi:hypothetical protein BWZ20_01310 [Winogradskyella sp. J14-2]|uniref:HYR-like domain-containing protein n=1 Tax=Winogradskyella sp. J14-2 TaxID=1936080 RepID=UPI000972B08F|nr:gliding motility-associated C-terminal domain-containing protein [Winogradskyella sp. J14-2]APY07019.1 hypothetical protein BWZ20_01310 [Winogradskyella sp. J14-2]